MVKFEDVVKWLKDNGFRRTAVDAPAIYYYMNEDKTLEIKITEHFDDNLTAEDEERIRERLRALGYL